MTSGIKLIENIEGTGEEAQRGDAVEFKSQGFLSQGECIQDRMLMTTIIGKRSIIAGIEYSLVGMKAGGYRKVKISPHLGYRNEGVDGKVPPNAVLIYELWVRRVEKTANCRSCQNNRCCSPEPLS